MLGLSAGASVTRSELDEHLDVFEHLGRDELAVMLVVARRLRVGLRQYGQLDVSDGRRWLREAGEELVDAGVYGAAEIVRLARERNYSEIVNGSSGPPGVDVSELVAALEQHRRSGEEPRTLAELEALLVAQEGT